MKTVLAFAMAMALISAAPVRGQRSGEAERSAQQHNQPRANRGHIPTAPAQRSPSTKPEPERRSGARINNTPHVNNDRWYGHDRPNDKRYHLNHPFEHGRFERFGPSYRYSIVRIDPNLHRFWLPGGFFFEIAAWEWPLCEDWCWMCGGDDFVIYDDPDHPGWYLVYNIHTGGFVHVIYMGM